jgi:hypothetical protein
MESNIELHESGQGRNHLPDETVQAGVGGRERSADEGLRSSQESRIKLKQSGQDAVSELRGGGEVVRGGVKRDWQWGSSTRWSAVEWILLAYLAGHHAKELLELMPKSILLSSSFLTSKPRERMAALSSRDSMAPDWSASHACSVAGLPGPKSCSPRPPVHNMCSVLPISRGRWSQNFDLIENVS